MNIDEARLQLLGQISVVRERIDKLESELVRQPMGAGLNEGIIDAIGNLSFQTGMLIGSVTKYQDTEKK